ncbi:MAG: nitronate monooxygenase family protein [Ottowia sp.]|uniref:NAD(P)H-dependent flavin oxidoreductase n=1 Tax=Ottowia sp. TaxID=1898956 RepID=UPI003C77A6A2
MKRKLPAIFENLTMPVIGSPMFIISNPDLVVEQCKAGIVGAVPALNARPSSQLDEWITEIRERLDAHDKSAARPAAPFAINLITHKTNARLDHDLEVVVRHKVPLVITSLGARPEVNAAIHSYGGVVLHDVINNTFARKAIEKGADGVIAVAAGAGGHAGIKSPFALIQEIRQWFDGPLALSGAMATGNAVLAALAMGADFAYIGSAFIATKEARASEEYKQAIVDGNSDEIVYTNLFTGVHGNYLKRSIRDTGLDPDHLPDAQARDMNFVDGESKPKAWKDVWGAGQGIGAVQSVSTVASLVDRLASEFHAARRRLADC